MDKLKQAEKRWADANKELEAAAQMLQDAREGMPTQEPNVFYRFTVFLIHPLGGIQMIRSTNYYPSTVNGFVTITAHNKPDIIVPIMNIAGITRTIRQ